MNNKVTIKNAEGQYLQHTFFTDQKTQNDFIAMLAETSAWGKAEHQVVSKEAVYDLETGEKLEDEEYETIPSEYSVEIEDVTEQLNQEKINTESEQYLRSTDWYVIREMDEGILCPQEIKELRSQARLAIVR